MRVLQGYDWPGNIRELANVLERAQILAEGTAITTDDLPENLLRASRPADSAGEEPAEVAGPDSLEGHERRHVAAVLQRHGGNMVHAAKALGVSRRTLYRLIEKYGLGESRDAADAGAPRPG
jgi:DNA-binding NtrC family response regulator